MLKLFTMNRIKNIGLLLSLFAWAFTSCQKDNYTISGLTVTADEGRGALYLHWDQGTCDSIAIYRSTGNDAPVFYALNNSFQSFYDYDIVPGETYNYQIVSPEGGGVESEVVSTVCPDFSVRLGDITLRQDGSTIYIDWNVLFAKADDNLKLFITRGGGFSVASVLDFSGGYSGIAADYGAAVPATTVRYTIELYKDDQVIGSVDKSISIKHNYKLSASNVTASIIDKAAKKISVKWDAAADAEAYKIATWINGANKSETDYIYNSTEGELTFSDNTQLNDGDKIEIKVIGYKTVGGEEYSGDSESVTLTW